MGLDTDLRAYLHRRAPNFLSTLTAIEKNNDVGLQAQSRAEPRLRYEPKKIFDGYGFCQLASAALAEGISRHFGDRVLVYGVVREVPNLGFTHEIIRVADNKQEMSVDATHRQIRPTRKSAILVFPSSNESRLYRGGTVCATPTASEIINKERRYVSAGVYANVTMRDFEQLVATLTER